MADDTIPQDDPRALTEDERAELACDWSDFRKDYGVSADDHVRQREHRAFQHAWQVARTREPQLVDEGRIVNGSLLGRLEGIVYPMGVHSTALDVTAAAKALVDGSTVREYRNALVHAEDRRSAAHAEIARVDTLEHVLRAGETR